MRSWGTRLELISGRINPKAALRTDLYTEKADDERPLSFLRNKRKSATLGSVGREIECHFIPHQHR